MPSIAAVSAEDIFQALKDLKIFNEDKTLKKLSDPVWDKACELLGLKMKKKNLYFFIQQDRKKMKSKLKFVQFASLVDKVINIKKDIGSESVPAKDFNVDEFDSLHEMAFSVEYHKTIHHICVNKFRIIYCLLEQFKLSKDLLSLREEPFMIVELDNFFKMTTIKGHSTKNLSFLIFGMFLDGVFLNLMQTVSEIVDENLVIKMCHLNLKNGVSPPSSIVLGYNRQLLHGVSISFNLMNFDDYNKEYYNHLKKNSLYVPTTTIKVDLFSLLSVMTENEIFNQSSEGLKSFLIKSIIFFSFLTNLEDFESNVFSFIMLLVSPLKNQEIQRNNIIWIDSLKSVKVNLTFKMFKDYQSQEKSRFIFSKSNDYQCLNDNNVVLNYLNALTIEIKAIINTLSNNDLEPNGFYCEAAYDQCLKYILSDILTWSNIIFVTKEPSVSVLHSASQNSSLFEKIESLKLSDFIKMQIEECKKTSLQGRTILINDKHNKNIKGINDLHFKNLNFEENWMGKNVTDDKIVFDSEESDEGMVAH